MLFSTDSLEACSGVPTDPLTVVPSMRLESKCDHGHCAAADPAHKGGGGPPATRKHTAIAKKKTRTIFSKRQIFHLESTFEVKRYLSSGERGALAAALQLTDTQVKIWFQNRRNKLKRQICTDTDVPACHFSDGGKPVAVAGGAGLPALYKQSHLLGRCLLPMVYPSSGHPYLCFSNASKYFVLYEGDV